MMSHARRVGRLRCTVIGTIPGVHLAHPITMSNFILYLCFSCLCQSHRFVRAGLSPPSKFQLCETGLGWFSGPMEGGGRCTRVRAPFKFDPPKIAILEICWLLVQPPPPLPSSPATPVPSRVLSPPQLPAHSLCCHATVMERPSSPPSFYRASTPQPCSPRQWQSCSPSCS